MNKKLITGTVAFVIGGIVAKVIKDTIVKRKELIEQAVIENEI